MKPVTPLAAGAAALLLASQAAAQSAFRGDCDQARRFADAVTFKRSYRGVQRMTPANDPCGRDVVAVYDLQRRNEANANYDLVGRYYYLWPEDAACREEVHDRLSGVARITQELRPAGLICEVLFRIEFDVGQDERYGPNRFAKQITLVGADTARFAATLPSGAEGTIFYEAQARTVDRAAGPADEGSEVMTARSRPPEAPAFAPPGGGFPRERRQFYDPRNGRFYFYDPTRDAYYWEDGTLRD